MIQPNEKVGMEIGYEYNDVFSHILICYISVVSGQQGPGIQACPDVPGLVQQLSTYTNKSHYGFFEVTVTPVRRVTARLGANLTGTSGSELRLDPQALIPSSVTGPLNSKYLHPYGGVDYRFAKSWTGKAYWDYYGYHEDPTRRGGRTCSRREILWEILLPFRCATHFRRSDNHGRRMNDEEIEPYCETRGSCCPARLGSPPRAGAIRWWRASTRLSVPHAMERMARAKRPSAKQTSYKIWGRRNVQKQSDTQLTEIITNGKNKMPAYGKSMKPEQIKDLVVYVRALSKK